MSASGGNRTTLVLTVSEKGAPASAIARAAEVLRSGGLVAFPTETVYGLGADATNPAAVEGIFAAKGRPHSDPLIVHIPDAALLDTVAAAAPPIAREFAAQFWPGPLTLILPRSEAIPASVAAGGATVGVRVPRHAVALALLREAGVPVAAPSANRFMHTSPTAAAHVLADLDGRVDCVLDAGPTEVGVESTVLDLTTEPPRVLRPGGVTLESLREVLPAVEGPRAASAQEPDAAGEPERAPGQMERHYAPHTRLVVFDGQGDAALRAMVREAGAALRDGQRVGVLAADEEVGAFEGLPVALASLGPGGDLAAISRQLYAALRELDGQGLDLLLAHTYGREGLGLALWDRLRKAAGGTPRPV
jgi:L-threonylcarbamoyladenylate synthase